MEAIDGEGEVVGILTYFVRKSYGRSSHVESLAPGRTRLGVGGTWAG